MIFTVIGGTSNGASNAAIQYAHIAATAGSSWSNSIVNCPCPGSGTVIGLRVSVTNAPSGASHTWSFSLVKNGTVQSMGVTITDTATYGEDLNSAHAFSYVAGDNLSIQENPFTFTANTGQVSWEITIQTTDGSQHIFGGVQVAAASGFKNVMSEDTFESTADKADTVMPIAGTWSNFYTNDRGGSLTGETHTWKLFVGNVASTIVVTIAFPTSGGSDTTHSVASSIGSVVCLSANNNGSSTNAGGQWSIKFTPTLPGKSLILHGGTSNVSNSATNYLEASGGGNSTINTTESVVQRLMPYMAVTDMRVRKATAPSPGTYNFTLMRNGVATGQSVTLFGASGDVQNIHAGIIEIFQPKDLMDIRCVPSGTPTAGAGLGWGIAGYVNPRYDQNTNTYKPSSL